MTDLSDERLAALTALIADADLPSPIEMDYRYDPEVECAIGVMSAGGGVEARVYTEETARLIEATLNALPPLLAEVTRLRASVRRECTALCNDIEEDRDRLTVELAQARQQLAECHRVMSGGVVVTTEPATSAVIALLRTVWRGTVTSADRERINTVLRDAIPAAPVPAPASGLCPCGHDIDYHTAEDTATTRRCWIQGCRCGRTISGARAAAPVPALADEHEYDMEGMDDELWLMCVTHNAQVCLIGPGRSWDEMAEATAEHEQLTAEADAAPVSVAVVDERHGYTQHGHACCGKATIGGRPNAIARCGGPGMCTRCHNWAAEFHATPAAVTPDLTVQADGPDTPDGAA